MEQNVIITNSNDENEQMRRKEIGVWFNDRSIHMNQSQILSHQLSYHKHQNNICPISSLDNASTNIQWWKDTAITDLIIEPEYQYEAVPSTKDSVTSNN
ncbi:hypothetical protein WN48_08357 [Eufriesea mexicana]|nr:hypothetical protein WN48_08357 [Eufriesea mexicana]